MPDNPQNKQNKDIVEALLKTYSGSGVNFIDVDNLPVRHKIIEILEALIELIFPGYTGSRHVTQENVAYIVGDILCWIRNELSEQITKALSYQCRLRDCSTKDCRKMAEAITDKLLNALPEIRETLKQDVQAAYDGDPAADSFEEIVISYPGLIAIATHRIAHELYQAEVPLIPRIMSENAHSKTGIDIHPGAKIGEYFFIDHGTGVVIGETAVIGRNVKIYQGVTLGALSFPKDERGRVIKGGKRHPTIEDDVTIYAEATILGDVVIGHGAVISGNTWVMKSVPPKVTVVMTKPESKYKTRKKTKSAGENNIKEMKEFLDWGAYI
jgi:serine O-acetyltransferase